MMARRAGGAGRSAAANGYSSWPRWVGRKPVPVKYEIEELPLSQRGSGRVRLPPRLAGSGPTQPRETTMRYYTQSHRFYAGIDLHARTLHLCVLDQQGSVVCDQNLPAKPEALLRALAPFRDDVILAAECMFAWYWVADRCAAEGIPFVIGHALYMKLIHGAKAKNDRIDAAKIARLLRGGNFPLAYVYPRGMRETRDLLRRRHYFVRQRAALRTHLEILNAQYNLPPFAKKLSFAANRQEMNIAERFEDQSVQHSAAADLALIDRLDEQIAALRSEERR